MADEKKKTNKKRRDYRESNQVNGGGGKLHRGRDALTPVQKVRMGYPMPSKDVLKCDGPKKARHGLDGLVDTYAKSR